MFTKSLTSMLFLLRIWCCGCVVCCWNFISMATACNVNQWLVAENTIFCQQFAVSANQSTCTARLQATPRHSFLSNFQRIQVQNLVACLGRRAQLCFGRSASDCLSFVRPRGRAIYGRLQYYDATAGQTASHAAHFVHGLDAKLHLFLFWSRVFLSVFS